MPRLRCLTGFWIHPSYIKYYSNKLVDNTYVCLINVQNVHHTSLSFEPFNLVFIILQPPSIFTRFRCWLKLHVGISPLPCNNIVVLIFWTNTLEQRGQELPPNFFILKIVSFSLPFLLNCLYFSRNIYSLTSSIES